MEFLQFQKGVKRFIDISGALIGLILFSPVILFCAVAVYLSMGLPIFFRQIRPGFKGGLFTIYKFRTMIPPREDQVWFRSDEDRLTRVGRFLRKTSFDELPGLWNVLKGDMSLVGPRPLLIEYLEKYNEQQARRHDMKPGITGWAQVNGRQNIPFSERLRLDIFYIEHWSLYLDFKILIRTLMNVFLTKGVIPGQDVDDVDDIGLSSDREVLNNKIEKAEQ